MNLADYLLKHQCESDSVAVIERDQTTTYRSLYSHSCAVSAALKDKQILEQEIVLLVSDNSAFWIACYIGCMRAGVICAPLPPSLPAEQLTQIISETKPAALLVQEKYKDQVRPAIPDSTLILTERNVTSFKILPSQDFPFSTGNNRLAALMYTSGSTGIPRGVQLTHRNIIANSNSILGFLSLNSTDRMMVVLPFYYCFGTSLLHTHLRAGGSLVLNNQFMFPDKVLQQMVKTECTGLAGVPSTFQILLKRSSFLKMEFPRLRHIQQAGGKLSPLFLAELATHLPHVKIYVMYGQTEATARLSFLPPELLDVKKDSIGKGIPGVTLRVLKEGKPVAVGEVGEIVAEGENIAQGYFNDPEATAETFRSGCLFTGDLATVDADGFITIVDRAKDFLKCGGYRIASKYVEQKMLEFPGTIEAAVIGIADDIQGEAVRAFLVHSQPGKNNQEAFLQFCMRSFPPHLVPKEVVFMESLPKNEAGKILKNILRDIQR